MSEYKNLFKNTFAMLIGNFASKILIFLMLPLYTAVLTTEEYGIADLIFTTTNLLFPVLTCLATEYVLRFALERQQDKSRVLSSALWITIAGFLLLIMAFPLLKKKISVGNLWPLFYLYYLSTTLCSILSQFVKGLEYIEVYSASGVVNTFVTVLCNIVFLVKLKWGVAGYIAAYILGSVITSIFLWKTAHLNSYFRIIRKHDVGFIKDYLQFSIPMIPNSISWWVNNSLDKYMLTVFWGVSVTGVYAAGYKIPSFLTIISSIFLSAWQISAVKDFGSEEARLFFSNIYKKYASLVSLFGGIIIVCSRLISRILLSKEFFDAWKFAPILVYAFIFQTMSGFLGSIYTSSKKTSMLFISTTAGACINAGLNVLLIPNLGSTGAAIATAFSYIIVWLIRLVHSRYRIIKLDIMFTRDCVGYLILLVIVTLVILNIAKGIIIEVLLLLLLTIINKDNIESIVDMFYKFKKRIRK